MDPLQKFDYWNFSFEDMGKEDLTSMVDSVIASRNQQDECNKLTIITHSTGANQSLVAATQGDAQFADKVGKIINLAPCLAINVEKFWLPVRDLQSIKAFYAALAAFNITDLFGPNSEADVASFCESGGINGLLCSNYILPAMSNSLLRRTSLKDFQHVQQNTAVGVFREYVPSGQANPPNAAEIVYPLGDISIPVHVILSADDQACPDTENLKRYEGLPYLTSETLADGTDHIGMLSNDATFMTYLYAAMPQTLIPVDDAMLCPLVVVPQEPAPEVAAAPSCSLNFLDDYVPRRSRSRAKKLAKKQQ